MSTFFTYLKKQYPFLLISFFLPALILTAVYLGIGIYPGSGRSILASDAYSQFSNFHASFRNVLFGKQSIFYTWNASLGLNYLSLASYYLGGIFTPLVVFFPNQAMPDALYFITLIKIGAAGLSFYLYANHTFKLSKWNHLTLSVCYALMSFAIAHSEIIMWLDTFTFFPLIIWGINRVIKQKKGTLLFISYIALFTSNFYMGFMVGLFSGLYYLVLLISQWKQTKASFLPYVITTLLAIGASMIIILPTIMDLRMNGEALTKITTLKTEATGPFDFFIKNMVGVYDTTKYGSIPFIYIGLFPLSLFLFYFLSKNNAWKLKIGFFLLATLIITSFYLQPLNLFWQGMHAPNMFLFRFSFLLSFLIIMLAGYGWEQLDNTQIPRYLAGLLLLIGLFTMTYALIDTKKINYLDLLPFVVTLIFLLIYFITISSQKLGLFSKKGAAIVLLICVSMEMGLNANSLIHGILKDWNYASSSLYTKPFPSIKYLVDRTKKESHNFYRMENLDSVATNDGINYGYSGVNMFSSIRNRHSSSYLDALGFRSRGTNLNIRYNNNTLIGDAITGIKYNIASEAFNKYGFTKIDEKDKYTLYENNNALPLGFLVPSDDQKVTRISNDNLRNQTSLLNYLSGEQDTYFSFIPISLTRFENTAIEANGNETVYKEVTSNIGKEITWDATIPAKTQAYLSLFPTNYADLDSSNVTITTNGTSRKSQVNITGQYYDLGYYEEETKVTFSANFYGSKKVSFQTPKVVALNTVAYQRAIDHAKANGVPMQTTNRGASATVVASTDQSLIASIPYDKGWKAKVDGKSVKVESFKDGFIKIAIPKGKHTVKLSYLPSGFILGSILFVTCTALFIVFSLLHLRFIQKRQA